MKGLCKILPLLIGVLVSVSCVSHPLTTDDLQMVSPGMDHKSFQSAITKEPTTRFQVRENGSSYTVEVYPLQIGTKMHVAYHHPQQGGGYEVTAGAPVTMPYVFIFDSEGLMFWGFLAECREAENELVRRLAPLISAQGEQRLRPSL